MTSVVSSFCFPPHFGATREKAKPTTFLLSDGIKSSFTTPSTGHLQAAYLIRFGVSEAHKKQAHRILDFATQYNPRFVDGYIIHNEFFTPFNALPLATAVEVLLQDLTDKGSFKVITNPDTGLVQTSDTENKNMIRQWFTDSCMAGHLQRDKDPEGWKKSMITNVAALNSPAAQEAIKNTVANPSWYRKGGLMDGVFHIYLPTSVQLDGNGIPIAEKIRLDKKWFNQKRLESQALVLQNLVETVQAGFGLQEPKPWGFSPDLLESRACGYVVNAIASLAQYLIAVNTNPKNNTFNFKTPSASSWEEAPFSKGMTSDAALTVLAMQRLYQLLYKQPSNPNLEKIRQQIKEKAPDLTEGNLKAFIKKGQKFVHRRITQPLQDGKDPIQTPNRPYDTSLSILAASDYRFNLKNPVEDAKIRFLLVSKNKAALCGKNGMRRYNSFTLNGSLLHDSYLNQAYHLLPSLRKKYLKLQGGTNTAHGSSDASSADALLDRQTLSSPEYAAQWGLGLSASLQALAKAKLDVLHFLQKGGERTSEVNQLLKAINTESLDILNRNMATIPGPLIKDQPIIRADGSEVTPYLPMEAYEAVPCSDGTLKYIPGAHTLPWHAAQLYDGLKKLAEAQKLEEFLNK